MVYAAPKLEPTVYPLHLRIDVTPTGDWQIALGHRDTKPEGGVLSVEAVAGLLDAVVAAGDVSGLDPFLSPDSDLDQVAAERRTGQALSGVLNANPRLSGLFSFYLGHADQAGSELLLAIDVSDPTLRALPWELIARDDSSIHLERARLTVARLGPGPLRIPAPPRGLLQSVVWCPQPDEPISAGLLATLTAAARRHHQPDPILAGTQAPDPDAVVVLHIICHGQRHRDQLALLFDETARDVDGVLQQLIPLLPQVDLVVLSVCESAVALPTELEGMVGQLLSHGATAVVAPCGPLAAEAAGAFLDGLTDAIVAGGSLIGVVGAGRRAVRTLSLPWPDARWSRLQLTLSSLQPPDLLMWQGWRPEGWPRPDAVISRLLQQARTLADSSGFVGIEHLLLALASVPAVGFMKRICHLCLARKARLTERLAGLTIGPGEPDWRGTPRLRSLADALQPGFSLDDLWEALCLNSAPLIEHLLGGPLAQSGPGDFETTAPAQLLTISGLNAVGLEVLGGPEDGHCIFPRPGALIGRWSEPARCDHPLYSTCLLWDRRLSRAHLRWEGGGQVRFLSAGLHLRPGFPPAQLKQARLSVGDIIQLGDATLLRGIDEVTP
ncbi:MAG: hypothetical protein ACI8RZ_005629 [Myxococcota bacterium]|jgi:hypothetical protein